MQEYKGRIYFFGGWNNAESRTVSRPFPWLCGIVGSGVFRNGGKACLGC